MAAPQRRGLFERARLFSARLDERRSPWSYIAFSVLFLSSSLLWTRLPATRPASRYGWAICLLVLAIRDFALGLRRMSRAQGRADLTWIIAAAAYGIVATALVAFSAWQRG